MGEAENIDQRYILRSTPLFLDLQQRIRYESIALTTDIMEINLSNLHKVAQFRVVENPDAPSFTRQERALMISLAWSIVDQADLLRQFIHAEGKHIDLKSARDFLELSSKARDLRNWMDHLPQRIASYVAKSGKLPPAHGALSFTYIDPEVAAEAQAGGPLRRYRTIVILSTAMQRALEVEGVPYEYDRFDVPTDHFVLQGFGHMLPLVDLVRRAATFCDEFADKVDQWCRAKAVEIARAENRPLEQVMKGSDLPAGTLVMKATYNEG